MSSKLVQRYNKISAELDAIQRMMAKHADNENFQKRVTTLKAEQNNVRETMRFIALSHIRDEAWRALAIERHGIT